jgi:pimeloyl-ACP methyl ester carboxylesterase
VAAKDLHSGTGASRPTLVQAAIGPSCQATTDTSSTGPRSCNHAEALARDVKDSEIGMTAETIVHGLSCERMGDGEPLLLIHGTGSSRSAWRPVARLLAAHHELVVLDLPGHGDSALPPASVTPNAIGYAPLLADLLDALGFQSVHCAGFSVGGWTCLELAKLGRARSVTAFGCAGLWKPRSPRSSEASLWLTYRSTRLFGSWLPLALRTAVGRTMFLSQQFGRPWRLTAEEAVEAARAMGAVQGFAEHLKATNHGARFSGGQEIDVPVTIAFGSRERLLSRGGARRRDELPPHTRWLDLPGCGHVPTWDDPALVTRAILETTGQAAAPDARARGRRERQRR